MRRREFITALSGAVAAVIPTLLQGAEKVYLIGWLGNQPGTANRAVFTKRLQELGYSEGKNLKIEWRWSEGHLERLPGLAGDLVSLKPDLIIAIGGENGLAAQKATNTIPIVVLGSHGGVEAGLYNSLPHPGGNITGYDGMSPELDAKRVEMVKEILPQMSHMTVLQNPTIPGARAHFETISAAAEKLGIALHFVEYRAVADLDNAFEAVLSDHPDALFAVSENILFVARKRLADFGLEHKIAIFNELKEYVDLGGLVSYGPDLSEYFRRGAYYVDKILKGEKPGDIPVEQPTKFDLAINLKTAKALDITIPNNLIVSASAVIE
jgi:putative tryptophan/tyrosine transport system substrate-binding protein